MTQNEKILELLRRGPATNSDIVRGLGIFKYTSRLSELRADGHDIEARQIRKGLWEYRLIIGQRELF